MKPLNLNRREKYYVGAAAGILFVLLLFQLVISPIHNKRQRLARLLVEKNQELREMQALQAEYRELAEKTARAQSSASKRPKNFDLYNYLISLADQLSIKNNVSKAVPDSDTIGNLKVSKVELKIDTIIMEQLTKYLHEIEVSGNDLYVTGVSITQTKKPEGYIDVVLEVETIVS